MSKKNREIVNYIIPSLLILGALAVPVIMCVFISSLTNQMKEASYIYMETNRKTMQLCSITTDSKYTGVFTIGYGSFDRKDMYVTYVVQEDGGKKYLQMDRSVATIYEILEDTDTPYAEIQFAGDGDTVKWAKLYVPKNTIVQEIDIGL